MSGAIIVNGLKVHTGQLPTDEIHLDSLRRVTSEITDIGFYRRNPDTMAAERVKYDQKAVEDGKNYLGITVRGLNGEGEEATLFVGGQETISDVLKDLMAEPIRSSRAKRRTVNAYRDGLTLYGLRVVA